MRWTRKRGWLAAIFVLVVVVAGGIVAFQLWRRGRPYRPPRICFEGGSADLRQTVVVPTLDTPMPAGKNVVWCGSLQIAWNRLRDDLLGGPPSIAGAEAVVSRLNHAGLTEADLPEDSYFAAAGFLRDGIVERVQSQMKEQFQVDVSFDDMPEETAALVYSYLQAQVKFTIPFFENREEFLFRDSEGRETSVTSFGIREEDDYAYPRLRRQVEVLFIFRDRSTGFSQEPDEFIVDLCRDSAPNQIVLACVSPKETLAATLDDVREKITGSAARAFGGHIGPNDVVLVPNMQWEIDNRFAELEGPDRPFLNQGSEGYYCSRVRQTIRFRLDRSGAELSSQVKSYVAPEPTYLLCNRPFLVYLKRRDADRPFFVMWVDNAELLSKP